jgi:hypothetical protein
MVRRETPAVRGCLPSRFHGDCVDEPNDRQDRFQIQKLEERIAPGTLTVSPPNSISDGTSNTVVNTAKPGLQTATAHNGGVITWSPET